jgi:uncharacterized membrane protein (DUF485 family)
MYDLILRFEVSELFSACGRIEVDVLYLVLIEFEMDWMFLPTASNSFSLTTMKCFGFMLFKGGT